MLGILIAILVFILVVWLGTAVATKISDWSIHRDMTTKETKTYGYAKYPDFVREFNKIENDLKEYGSANSYYKVNGNTFSASIIEFNNIGMVMRTPWDLWRVNRFMKRKVKNQLHIHDWSE